jgi:hypothetical protein
MSVLPGIAPDRGGQDWKKDRDVLQCLRSQLGGWWGLTKRNTWKDAERRVARDLGGRRIPVTGIDRHGADVLTGLFAVQVKIRKCFPVYIWDWLEGIVGDATTTGRVGILILKKPRQRDADGLVVMRYADFVDLHGDIEGTKQ